MATTIDSGTETLFSEEDDDSSPTSCYDLREQLNDNNTIQTDVHNNNNIEDTESVNSRLAPPNIQPHSGVLEKVNTFSC